jgi:hypothetical protein
MDIVFNKIADTSVKVSIRKGEDAQYLIPVRDLSYWKTKLRAASAEWYRESGKQKESTLSTTTKTMGNLGSRDTNLEGNLSSQSTE